MDEYDDEVDESIARDLEQQGFELLQKIKKRKENHNIIERRRRDHINATIQLLGTLLPPSLCKDQKLHKGLILSLTVDHIKLLAAENEVLRGECKRLRKAAGMGRSVELSQIESGAITVGNTHVKIEESDYSVGMDRTEYPVTSNNPSAPSPALATTQSNQAVPASTTADPGQRSSSQIVLPPIPDITFRSTSDFHSRHPGVYPSKHESLSESQHFPSTSRNTTPISSPNHSRMSILNNSQSVADQGYQPSHPHPSPQNIDRAIPAIRHGPSTYPAPQHSAYSISREYQHNQYSNYSSYSSSSQSSYQAYYPQSTNTGYRTSNGLWSRELIN
ncbi:hypothetical protein BKA69DRAFT_568083 [Paraphysoderma sedebokerense]|nr:hypothetical protein BKA69DRAFT_568083 [Paraphysoderma sedebokerense]